MSQQQLQELCSKTYKEQAVWFLNCFWLDFAEKDAELIWNYVLKNEELDLENHKEGCGLDEMKAHVFLEKFDETLTVRDMRDRLRSTGAIGQTERPKLVPLTHYLLYKYNADWKTLVDETRQGGNQEELEEAERLLKEVQALFQESEAKAAEARKALAEAKSAEAAAVSRENEAKAREDEAKASEAEAKAREQDAVARENEAREAEAPFKAAQEELQKALDDVKREEDEYNGKIADCERRSTQGGVVQQNKAKAELAQLRAEDPLPLRKAKITLEAAEKRAAKARAPFEAATKKAEDARAVATSSRQAAEKDAQAASQARQAASQARQAASDAAGRAESAKNAADAALDAAAARLQEAEDYLNEVKSKPGISYGSIWWLDRELHEQKKYLPTSRGGIAK